MTGSFPVLFIIFVIYVINMVLRAKRGQKRAPFEGDFEKEAPAPEPPAPRPKIQIWADEPFYDEPVSEAPSRDERALAETEDSFFSFVEERSLEEAKVAEETEAHYYQKRAQRAVSKSLAKKKTGSKLNPAAAFQSKEALLKAFIFHEIFDRPGGRYKKVRGH